MVPTEAFGPQVSCSGYGVQEFRTSKGRVAADGQMEDPVLEDFEAEIAKYKAVQDDIQVR